MILKLLGFLILLISFICIYFFESHSHTSGLLRILHWPAMLLTGLGPIGLLMICIDGSAIQQAFQLIWRSPAKLGKQIHQEKQILRELIEKFYILGHKAFEETYGHQISQETRIVLEKLSLRIPISDVKELLQFQKEQTEESLAQAMNVMNLGVRLTPSIGMLGTILGMVQLLESLKNPSEIGSHMSLALLTTFFGLFFSLTLWTPLLNRLQGLLNYHSIRSEHLMHWLTLMEGRKPPEYWVQH